MALAEKTATYPEGARFVWNVEVLWAADLFLQRMERRERAAFEKAVKSGQVGLNGLYLNVLTGLARPEELVQSTRMATRLSERLGVTIDTAMISDIPGHTWGLVPALAQAGIRYFSTSPNFFDRIGTTQVASADQPFWWVGPSGRERVLTWNTWMGYALSHTWNARMTPDHVAAYLDHLAEINYPYDITYIRWSGLGDNAEPEPSIADFVKDWNARYRWPRFVISDQHAPFAALEQRYGDQPSGETRRLDAVLGGRRGFVSARDGDEPGQRRSDDAGRNALGAAGAGHVAGGGCRRGLEEGAALHRTHVGRLEQHLAARRAVREGPVGDQTRLRRRGRPAVAGAARGREPGAGTSPRRSTSSTRSRGRAPTSCVFRHR